MVANTFFRINNNGIKSIKQECIPRKNNEQRKYSALSTPIHTLQRPFLRNQCTERRYNKTWTRYLRSEKDLSRPRIIRKCTTEVTEKEMETEEEIPRSTLLWRAAKLPMYTVALIPVTVGSAVAYWQTGQFFFGRYFAILVSFIIVIVWLNLSNDVYDFDTGADKNKKESVVNLFGRRTVINFVAWSLLVIGVLGLSSLAVAAKNSRSVVLLASTLFCCFLYQCPPFRLGYYGLGELLIIVSWSQSTIAFYLLHSRASELPISGTIIWSSLLVGVTTALILFCSHFHQIEGDKDVGKISPLVRLGTQNGARVVKFGVIGLYSLVLSLGICQALPLASVILCAMTFPIANFNVGFVEKNHMDKAKIFMSKYYFVRLHTLFGLALSGGLVLARLLAKHPISPAIMV